MLYSFIHPQPTIPTTLFDNVHLSRGFPGVHRGANLSSGVKLLDGICYFPKESRTTNFLWDSLEAFNAFHSEIIYLNETLFQEYSVPSSPITTDTNTRTGSSLTHTTESSYPTIIHHQGNFFDIPIFFCRNHLPSHALKHFRYADRLEQICTTTSQSDSTTPASSTDNSLPTDASHAFFTDMMNLAITARPRRMAIYHNVFINKYGMIINTQDCSFVRNGGCWFMNHPRIFIGKFDAAPRPLDDGGRGRGRNREQYSSSNSSSIEGLLHVTRQLRSSKKEKQREIKKQIIDKAKLIIEERDDRGRETTRINIHDRQERHEHLKQLTLLNKGNALTKHELLSLQSNHTTMLLRHSHRSRNITTPTIPIDYYNVSSMLPLRYIQNTSLDIFSMNTYANIRLQHNGNGRNGIYYDRVIALTAGASGTWHFPMEVFVALAGVDKEILQSSYIMISTGSNYMISWLALLGIHRGQLLVPRGGGYMAKTLYVPEMGRCAEPSFTQLQWLRGLFGLPLDTHLIRQNSQSKKGESTSSLHPTYNTSSTRTLTVLYLQRVSSRIIPNNHELKYNIIKYTKQYNLNFILHHEQYLPSLSEQVRQFAKTDIIIAPHGAGLLFTTFVPSHACVIEIMPDIRPECFARIAYLRGLNYILHLTDQTQESLMNNAMNTTKVEGEDNSQGNSTIDHSIIYEVNVTDIIRSLDKCRRTFKRTAWT